MTVRTGSGPIVRRGGKIMTFIEFYERDNIENLCGCLTRTPERVVLVGDK